jgi:DNA-binding ferritin-like protein (Dps family)
MAKAKFDIKTLELPAAAAKPLYAGVGATDLAVEYVREYVADVQKKFAEVQKDVQSRVSGVQKDVQTRVSGVQKNVKDFEFEPKALREQTVTVVNSRVTELRSDAKVQAEKVQSLVNDNVATVTDTYGDLARRGEQLVARIRKQEATKATVASAQTTAAKAKTTKTQAKTGAKKASSSAKATRTSAKKTASKAGKATTTGAKKVGN